VLRRQRWTIALIFACSIAIAAIWNVRSARVYEATVTLLASPTKSEEPTNARLPPQVLFQNRTVAQDVIASLRLQRFALGPEEFAGDHVAVDEASGGLIHVTVRLADAVLAAAAANQVAERAVELAKRIGANERDAKSKDLERQLAEAQTMLQESDEAVLQYVEKNRAQLTPETVSLATSGRSRASNGDGANDRAALPPARAERHVATPPSNYARDAELRRLTSLRDGVQAVHADLAEQYAAARVYARAMPARGLVQIVDGAIVPSRPVSPRTLWNLAIAAVAGLLVSVAVAFVLDFLRTAADRGRSRAAAGPVASERL
jgi:uncharacterized protein involved in exopolysaccharide biosynthesis